MKLPRLSIGSIMTALVVVAIDCAVVRSVIVEKAVELSIGHFTQIVVSILAMTNVLAVVIARMVRDGLRARPSRVGFALGGFCGIMATVPGLMPALLWFSSSSVSRPLRDALFGWMTGSPIREGIVSGLFLCVLPLLFQMALASFGGWVFARLGFLKKCAEVAARPSLPRRIGGLTTLLLLLAVPIPAVGGLIRWNLDPNLARLMPGQEGVVSFLDGSGRPIVPVTKGFKLPNFDGAKVRVVSDAQPMQIEIYRTGKKEEMWDRRPVQVTLLDGNKAGQTVDVPHRYIRLAR